MDLRSADMHIEESRHDPQVRRLEASRVNISACFLAVFSSCPYVHGDGQANFFFFIAILQPYQAFSLLLILSGLRNSFRGPAKAGKGKYTLSFSSLLSSICCRRLFASVALDSAVSSLVSFDRLPLSSCAFGCGSRSLASLPRGLQFCPFALVASPFQGEELGCISTSLLLTGGRTLRLRAGGRALKL